MRGDEWSAFTFGDQNGESVAFSIVSFVSDYDLNAILSIIRTIFVSFILGGGAMLFSKDVEDFIVSPIEKMLEKV